MDELDNQYYPNRVNKFEPSNVQSNDVQNNHKNKANRGYERSENYRRPRKDGQFQELNDLDSDEKHKEARESNKAKRLSESSPTKSKTIKTMSLGREIRK